MLQGSYVALVTPFKNGSVDWTALENLINFHLQNGTDGILLLGTTAEAVALAGDEKDALLRQKSPGHDRYWHKQLPAKPCQYQKG